MPLDGAHPLPAPLDAGCLYLLKAGPPCGCTRQPGGSPYCAQHHALCHLVPGSRGEIARIAEIEIAAKFVGGRLGRRAPLGIPPSRFMRALDARLRKR